MMEDNNLENQLETGDESGTMSEQSTNTEQRDYRPLTFAERTMLIIGILIVLAFAVVTLRSLNQDKRGVSTFYDEDIDEGGSHINDILTR